MKPCKSLVPILLLAVLCLLAGQPAWADKSACNATVQLKDGTSQKLTQVAHNLDNASYPYLVGQQGTEVLMLDIKDVKSVSLMDPQPQDAPIGLTGYTATLKSGKSKPIFINGYTSLAGAVAGGDQRIPFNTVKSVEFGCH